MEHNKFDLIPCECGRCLRHRTAEPFGCRSCKQDDANDRANAALEWALTGEKPVNRQDALALSAGAPKEDEAEYISRKTPGNTEVDHRLARMRAERGEAEYRQSRMRRGKDD
jgi:hypothetical protein